MYTKGEWRTVIEGNGYWKIYGKNNEEIAVAYNAKTDKILEANAHLIASAPDLYEFARQIERSGLLKEYPNWLEGLENILAKAAGK